MRRLLCCLAIAVLAVAAPAAARVTLNTVAPKAKLGADGERAKPRVLLACDRSQEATLKVTLTQGSARYQARALGRGNERVLCVAQQSAFGVVVTAKKGSFAPGKATACVVALTDDDSRDWCVRVKLVGR